MSERFSRHRTVVVSNKPGEETGVTADLSFRLESGRYNISPGVLYAEIEQLAQHCAERMAVILKFALKPTPPAAKFDGSAHLQNPADGHCKYCGTYVADITSQNCEIRNKLRVGGMWVRYGTNRIYEIKTINVVGSQAIVHAEYRGPNPDPNDGGASWPAESFVQRFFQDRRICK